MSKKKGFITSEPGLKVIKLEYNRNFKIKCNDWMLACLYSSFITSMPGWIPTSGHRNFLHLVIFYGSLWVQGVSIMHQDGKVSEIH